MGKKVSVDIDLVNYNTPTRDQFSYNKYNSYNELLPNTTHHGTNEVSIKIQQFSSKIDIDLPIKFAILKAGGRLSSSKSSNLILAWKQIEQNKFEQNTNLSNFFQYQEQNQELYISLSKEISDSWSFQVGLRAEATQTKGYSKEENNTHRNQYIKLFPTLYGLYKFSEELSLGLNYSKRINRPNYES